MATSRRRTTANVVIPATPTMDIELSKNGHGPQHLLPAPRGVLALDTLSDDLRKRFPTQLTTYQWFSKSNLDEAIECFKAIVQAEREERKNTIPFLCGAILDLYNTDRAEHAFSVVSKGSNYIVKPIRQIPPQITLYNSHPLSLRLQKLTTWSLDIPHSVLPTVTRVIQTVPPDDLYLATYEQAQSTKRDPLIYAQYGGWYVKVAEWK